MERERRRTISPHNKRGTSTRVGGRRVAPPPPAPRKGIARSQNPTPWNRLIGDPVHVHEKESRLGGGGGLGTILNSGEV